MFPVSLSKAVVVDDKEEEVAGLLKEFLKAQVPSLYLDGKAENLPDQPLKGLRLLIMDLFLDTTSNTIDSAESLFNRLVPENPGPYVIVVWTAQDETARQDFSKFIDDNPKKRPLGKLFKEKSQYETREGGFDFVQLITDIKNELALLGPYALVLEWERLIVESTDDTIVQLNRVMYDKNDAQEGNKLFRVLLEAGGGPSVIDSGDERRAISTIFDVLHRIQYDILMKNTMMAEVTKLDILNKLKTASKEIDEDLKAKIQSYLVLNSGQTMYKGMLPGNVYDIKKMRNPPWKVGYLTSEIVSKRNDGNVKVIEEHLGGLTKGDGVIEVILEVTPQCDIDQCNNIGYRFIGGILVRKDLLKNGKMAPKGQKADCQYDVKSFYLQSMNGIYALCLDFRFIHSVVKFDDLSQLCGVREQVVKDIQMHFGSHASRPGIVSIY
jgi:hypothetical protein